MPEDNNLLVAKKSLLIESLFNHYKNTKLFNILDDLFLEKAFDSAADLSINENLLTLETKKLTIKEICLIIDNFIKSKSLKNLQKKRQIYEIIKITALPKCKIEKIFDLTKYLLLEKKLQSISQESDLMCFDFFVLQIINNLSSKVVDSTQQKRFTALKKKILSKLVQFNYKNETKEKTTTFLCWVDMLLNFANIGQLPLKDFTIINQKILNNITPNIEVQWKVYAATSFLLKQPSFCYNEHLKSLKTVLAGGLEQEKNSIKCTKKDVTNIVASLLVNPKNNKENYYFLFDNIQSLSKNSDEDKLFCFDIIYYLLYQNKQPSFFGHRFGREYFLKTLFKLIDFKDKDDIKVEEFIILIKILSNDENFGLYNEDIFNTALNLLKSINNAGESVTSQLFYKFCDTLDFLYSKYHRVSFNNIPLFLASKKRPASMISKHFQLTIFKNTV